ncbi:MAG TPA: hypothetical protein VG889_04120 [Rhizomicrobium sp.]|nr:hypothetical protein [Rhizomicrobium sp.]
MRRQVLAALAGVGAGALLFALLVLLQEAGGRPELTFIAGAAVIFASAVAVFVLHRPAYGTARATLKLNEDPATQFIYPFRGENIAQIVARPETPLAMVLARFGDTFKRAPAEMTREITVTLKGSKKGPFPTLTLQQLFLTLKPFWLEHVLLVDAGEQFVGYIPGKRALKEFTGDNAADKITKYVVNPIEKPDEAGVLREIGGAPEADTVRDTDDARYAEAMLWANESVNGLVVKRRAKPVGFISKVDILRLNAGRP